MKKKGIAISLLMLLVLGASVQAELLVNGNFEDGNTGQVGSVVVPGWNSWGSNGWHNDDAGAVIDTKSMKFWWDGVGMWQDFTATAGVTYDFSVQVIDASRDTTANNWDLQIEAEFYNASNVALVKTAVGYFDSTIQPNDVWTQIGGTLVAPVDTAYGRVVIRSLDWNSGIGGSLYFDNASVTAVPEPATLVLLGLGGLVLGRRK